MAFRLDQAQSLPKPGTSHSKESWLKKDIGLFGPPFSNKVKEDFYIELGVLLKAGINLKNGLELIINSTKKKSNASVLRIIHHDIISGLSLSESIIKHKAFTDYEYYSLKIGEETGTLFTVCNQLGEFFQRKNEQRRNLISALTYPVIILITALLVVIFMLKYVVPMFEEIFAQQNVELPLLTKAIIKMSSIFDVYGGFILILILLLIVGRKLFGNNKSIKRYNDRIVLRLPFIGGFTKIVYLTQFTQAVSLLTASKVPVLNCIRLVKRMIRFHPLIEALESVEKDIIQGLSLSEALGKHQFFDDKMVAMIKVAEETNQTSFIFDRLNTQYNDQVTQKAKMISTIMEPLIILIIGILVGVILIAMYLPMFRLSSVLG